MRDIRVIGVCVGALLGLCGCETSKWRQNLVVGPDTNTSLAAEAGVRVREVPWERVDATLKQLHADLAASDRHFDEWPTQQKQAHKAKLLQGLQISEPAESVRVLGQSEFKSTDNTASDPVELVKLARELGADTVVRSSKYVGKADKIVQEPVTTYSTGTVWWRDGDHRRPDSFSEQQTTWVPVRIQADETAYIAFFLRTK